jgi:hypothetical protein
MDHKYKLFNKYNSFASIPWHYPCRASGKAAEKRDSANLSLSLMLDAGAAFPYNHLIGKK